MHGVASSMAHYSPTLTLALTLVRVKSSAPDDSRSTGNSRETGRAVWGGGEVRSTEEAGECRRREGTSVKDGRNTRRRTWGLTTSLATLGCVQKSQTASHVTSC